MTGLSTGGRHLNDMVGYRVKSWRYMGLHLNDRVGYRGKSGRYMGLHLNDRYWIRGDVMETHGVTS